MKKFIAKLLKLLSSNRHTQSLFSFIQRVALFGLFGDEWDFLRNGELGIIKKVAAKPTSQAIVFDVGANEGIYCQCLLDEFSKTQTKLTVHGFEPASDTFKRSAKFVGNSSVVCNNIGLSHSIQKLRLFKSSASSGFATLHAENKFNFDTSEEVSFTTLDEYCQTHILNTIDFLKMDVEGHELSVLKGATNLLQSKEIKAIQFEFGSGNISSKTYFKDFYDLLNSDYQLYRILKNGMYPIAKYDYSLEVFGRVSNYVAFLKIG